MSILRKFQLTKVNDEKAKKKKKKREAKVKMDSVEQKGAGQAKVG